MSDGSRLQQGRKGNVAEHPATADFVKKMAKEGKNCAERLTREES